MDGFGPLRLPCKAAGLWSALQWDAMGFLRDVVDTIQEWLFSAGSDEVVRVAGSAMVVYVVALWITRAGKHRFLGGNTVFDVLLGFILGSTLSRAINGNADLVASALAGFVLIGMHFLFSFAASRSRWVGHMVKGGYEELVRDGVIDERAMQRHFLTRNDLMQAARQKGLEDVSDIRCAYFERSGDINVVPAFRVRVAEIDVKEGVQKVRLEIYD